MTPCRRVARLHDNPRRVVRETSPYGSRCHCWKIVKHIGDMTCTFTYKYIYTSKGLLTPFITLGKVDHYFFQITRGICNSRMHTRFVVFFSYPSESGARSRSWRASSSVFITAAKLQPRLDILQKRVGMQPYIDSYTLFLSLHSYSSQGKS